MRLSRANAGITDDADLVCAAIEASSDRSSLSDELRRHQVAPVDRRHISPQGSNLLRGLEFTSEMRVLEIGSGYGALGRFLGETCRTVDLLEEDPSKAAVAALRTADLPGVQVFFGQLDDVPPDPAYDVIVCGDGLARVGEGSAEAEPYARFLRDLARRLKPGGTLVLAAENPLGVKYLAGKRDDHTRRLFDGPEGYPEPPSARALSRTMLTSCAKAAGLEPTILAASPDHKMTAALISHAAFETVPHLARDVQRAVAPDYIGSALDVVDERLLWRSLCDAGIGFEFANSYLLLAGKGGPSALWPEDRLAVRFTSERRRDLATVTTVTSRSDGVWATRRLIAGAADDSTISPDLDLRWQATTEPVHHGPLLSDLIYRAADPRPLLESWARLVASHDPGALDLQPWNIIVTAHGLEIIDQEWHLPGFSHEQTLLRGLVIMSRHFARSRHVEGELARRTCGEVVREWAAAIGVDATDEALDEVIDIEARIGAAVYGREVAEARQRIADELAATLGSLRRPRVDVRLRKAEASVRSLQKERDEMRELLGRRRVHRAVVAENLRDMKAPLWRRVASSLRHTALGDLLISTPPARRLMERLDTAPRG